LSALPQAQISQESPDQRKELLGGLLVWIKVTGKIPAASASEFLSKFAVKAAAQADPNGESGMRQTPRPTQLQLVADELPAQERASAREDNPTMLAAISEVATLRSEASDARPVAADEDLTDFLADLMEDDQFAEDTQTTVGPRPAVEDVAERAKRRERGADEKSTSLPGEKPLAASATEVVDYRQQRRRHDQVKGLAERADAPTQRRRDDAGGVDETTSVAAANLAPLTLIGTEAIPQALTGMSPSSLLASSPAPVSSTLAALYGAADGVADDGVLRRGSTQRFPSASGMPGASRMRGSVPGPVLSTSGGLARDEARELEELFFRVRDDHELYNLGQSYNRDFMAGARVFGFAHASAGESQKRAILGVMSFIAYFEEARILVLTDRMSDTFFGRFKSPQYLRSNSVDGREYQTYGLNSIQFLEIDEIAPPQARHRRGLGRLVSKVIEDYDVVLCDLPSLDARKENYDLYLPLLRAMESVTFTISLKRNRFSEIQRLQRYFSSYNIKVKGSVIDGRTESKQAT